MKMINLLAINHDAFVTILKRIIFVTNVYPVLSSFIQTATENTRFIIAINYYGF
jgi:hypothetical protein